MRKFAAVMVLFVFAILVTAPVLADGPDGKALFASKCAMCHGADGVAKSMAKGSGNFNDPAWQSKASLETIEKTIAEGKGKMTKFAEKLKPEEIKAVAAYVKSIK